MKKQKTTFHFNEKEKEVLKVLIQENFRKGNPKGNSDSFQQISDDINKMLNSDSSLSDRNVSRTTLLRAVGIADKDKNIGVSNTILSSICDYVGNFMNTDALAVYIQSKATFITNQSFSFYNRLFKVNFPAGKFLIIKYVRDDIFEISENSEIDSLLPGDIVIIKDLQKDNIFVINEVTRNIEGKDVSLGEFRYNRDTIESIELL